MLRFAPIAAVRAAAAGAYREAAAQYARALRFAGGLPPEQRAALLEGRSRACYLADDQLEAIEVIRAAIACRQQQGAPAQEARALTELADYLSCRGFLTEAHETVRQAGLLAREAPEQLEHAYVFTMEGRLLVSGDPQRSIELARRAIELGEEHGDEHVAGHARVTVGVATAGLDLEAGVRLLEEAAEIAHRHRQPEVVVRALNGLGAVCANWEQHERAETYFDAGLALCATHTSDLWRINMLALSARSYLAQGRFDRAAERAVEILDDPRESPWPHFTALLVLGLTRARRGDPGALEALDQTATVALQPDELEAHADRAAAYAEIAWTERRSHDVASATEAILSEAAGRGDVDTVARLTFWRRLAGSDERAPDGAAGPYALALAGAWSQAAEEWRRRGRPYEAALALAETGEEDSLREALAELQRLGALPAARLVTQRLRERGVRGLARGPRAATRENAAGLTAREVDVVGLLAAGLRNADIGERLFLSPRTVGHHVSAILRKLDASSRGEAVATARRLGVLQEQ